MTKIFKLDSRLAANSYFIMDWPLSSLYFKKQADYPWCILIPRVDAVSEIYQLQTIDQIQLIKEIAALSEIMQVQFHPDKLNIGALGNQVAQLHIHVVARYQHDPLWPHGIWQPNLVQSAYPDGQDLLHLQDLQQQAASYFVDSLSSKPDNGRQ